MELVDTYKNASECLPKKTGRAASVCSDEFALSFLDLPSCLDGHFSVIHSEVTVLD